MSDPRNITEWLQQVPIVWLVGNENGLADVTSYGSVLDDHVSLVRQAVKARMPNKAPSDALGYIGNDRVLIQGASEADTNFRTRLQTAWDDWARAGTALELLVQLFWAGFPGSTIVQQNGLYYQLSGDPVAGEDPTSLLVIGDLGVDITQTITGVGNPPWWSFDTNTDHTSRFAVILSSGGAFTTSGVATFTASDTATVTWNNPFSDANYIVQPGAVDAGGGGITVITGDPSTKTPISCGLVASGAFTGTCEVLAWQVGENPFADLHAGALAKLRSVIETWRPAKALCMGATLLIQGNLWGWPVQNWGDVGLTWGSSESVTFSVP